MLLTTVDFLVELSHCLLYNFTFYKKQVLIIKKLTEYIVLFTLLTILASCGGGGSGGGNGGGGTNPDPVKKNNTKVNFETTSLSLHGKFNSNTGYIIGFNISNIPDSGVFIKRYNETYKTINDLNIIQTGTTSGEVNINFKKGEKLGKGPTQTQLI